ncbi:MAG: SHOCT domain-containing protein [Gammaproteobacteria bacterium]|nr:SHOCT domain-containing protein [Gammaproteobacteria bacterium]
MMNYDGHFFGGGFMWIFWILIIAGIFFLFQYAIKGGSGSSLDKETPMEILKKRYARGEIDEEEFERRRKELES